MTQNTTGWSYRAGVCLAWVFSSIRNWSGQEPLPVQPWMHLNAAWVVLELVAVFNVISIRGDWVWSRLHTCEHRLISTLDCTNPSLQAVSLATNPPRAGSNTKSTDAKRDACLVQKHYFVMLWNCGNDSLLPSYVRSSLLTGCAPVWYQVSDPWIGTSQTASRLRLVGSVYAARRCGHAGNK